MSGIRTLIVGAGDAGKTIARELLNSKSVNNTPICFVDDDATKKSFNYHGIPVLGTSNDIPHLVKEHSIDEIFICIPSAERYDLNRLYSISSQTGCKVKVLPGLYQLINGNGLSLNIREVGIDDLLGRKQKEILTPEAKDYYKDKVVLITGGGGSIGSELCRQVAKMSPKKIVILDIYENCAYDLQQEIKMEFGGQIDLDVEITSICNRKALERVFAAHRPNIVIMAAAHKHVPLMEHNVIEAVENNVFGTLNTIELAEQYEVDRVHMVSTDKAVNPTNVMGATKRICEMLVETHANIKQHTTFSITRFGNVLGSAGSVIPLFKRQIAKGGPVTVTDFRIIRYFMTIPEASQLVLKSASMAKNGELFVLDMGEPVKILTLAENMIRLSGYEPYSQIKIIETGLRPGEKLYEELLVKSEELDKTDDSLIFIERDTALSSDEMNDKLALLGQAVKDGDDERMKEVIAKVVPTYRRKENRADPLLV